MKSYLSNFYCISNIGDSKKMIQNRCDNKSHHRQDLDQTMPTKFCQKFYSIKIYLTLVLL